MDVIAVEKLTAAHCVVLLSSQELWRDCAFVLCLSSLASDSLPFVTGCAASHRGVHFEMSGVIQHERTKAANGNVFGSISEPVAVQKLHNLGSVNDQLKVI